MKQAYLIALAFMAILLLSSCEKDTSTTIKSIPDELEGIWFRSYPIEIWTPADSPPLFQGETHVRITFQDNGEFTHNKTSLGWYKGTSIDDTSGISINSGTFSAEEGKIEIILHKQIWWDCGNGNVKEFEEAGVISNRYVDVTYKILNEELNLVYFHRTDILPDIQETPGLDKFEEVYVKE